MTRHDETARALFWAIVQFKTVLPEGMRYQPLLNKKRALKNSELSSREDRIRTCDPLVPNQVRYRPALLPEGTVNQEC
jgi:hypothetical protein